MTTSQVGVPVDTAPSAAPAPLNRYERWLVPSLASLAVLGALFGALISPTPPAARFPAMAAGLAAQLLATLLLARQRSRPHLGFLAVTAVALVLTVLDSPWRALVVGQAVPWVPVALAGATVRVVRDARTPRQLRVAAVAAVTYCVVVGSAWAVRHGHPATAVTASIDAGVPILGGMCVSLAVRLRQARRDRVTELLRERAALARQARSDERRQLAARLHDTLGHVLTLLVLHANALAVASTDPAVRATGEQMSGLGRDGVRELRKALDLLHEDEPAAGARERVGHPEVPVALDGLIGPLVAQAEAAGQPVRLELHGARDPLAPTIAHTAHRVVQEGLTNARRHAPDTTVEVTVAARGTALDVTVRNAAAVSGPVSPGTGRGLAALRHRVTLLGGNCEYGSTADGGYALRVRLPLAG